MPSVGKLLETIGKLAPWDLAESWDRVGLQVGRRGQTVSRVLVALDLNREVLAEGLESGVDGFIVHHPLIFRPLHEINEDYPVGRLLSSLIRNNMFLIAVHTNMDKAAGGLNQALAERFGLKKVKVLEPHTPENCKLVVFTPAEAVFALRRAMSEAGAGVIGDYTECSYRGEGTGSFTPGPGAHPVVGSPVGLSEVQEVRLEMIAAQRDLSRVLQAIRAHHPYEEPAVDVYPLLNRSGQGLGTVGELPEAVKFEDFCKTVRDKLQPTVLRIAGDPGRIVKKVAICSGSGKGLLHRVLGSGADLYLTGELDYHEVWNARENDLAVIEAGHGSTEKIFIEVMYEYLRKVLPPEAGLEVLPSRSDRVEPYVFV